MLPGFVYLYMDALIVYPENEEQLAALKAVIITMKIPFEEKEQIYPDRIVQGVKDSLKDAEKGNSIPFKGIRNMIDPKKL